MFKRVLKLAPIIFLIFGISSSGNASTPIIRVLILKDSPEIRIYSKTDVAIYKLNGNAAPPPIVTKRAAVTVKREGIEINGRQTTWKRIAVSPMHDSLIWLNEKPYKGDIVIKKMPHLTVSAVNILPLEKYVEGILHGELPANWPTEALKAQAVAARSYALSTLDEKKNTKTPSGDYDIKATIEDQVYKGSPHSGSKPALAVKGTRSEIITYHNKPIKARFHSSCGGQTETSIHVWGEPDISRSIPDTYCKNSPHNTWKTHLTSQDITQKLKQHGFDPGYVRSIKPEKFDNGGRIAAVAIHGDKQTISLTGNDFRKFLGFTKIKSTLFAISKTDSGFTLTGKGFGHGVGMCQWGAKGMAERGHNYREILDFYYPGTTVKKWY